jgi:hypothetical protein
MYMYIDLPIPQSLKLIVPNPVIAFLLCGCETLLRSRNSEISHIGRLPLIDIFKCGDTMEWHRDKKKIIHLVRNGDKIEISSKTYDNNDKRISLILEVHRHPLAAPSNGSCLTLHSIVVSNFFANGF